MAYIKVESVENVDIKSNLHLKHTEKSLTIFIIPRIKLTSLIDILAAYQITNTHLMHRF